jgi:hypothetical protein
VGYWPAFWMLGPKLWPGDGEIDIMADVNGLPAEIRWYLDGHQQPDLAGGDDGRALRAGADDLACRNRAWRNHGGCCFFVALRKGGMA